MKLRRLSSERPPALTEADEAGGTQRKQWVLVGTAGASTLAGLSVGAMGIANAMQVRDAAGSPVSGTELRGDRASRGAGASSNG